MARDTKRHQAHLRAGRLMIGRIIEWCRSPAVGSATDRENRAREQASLQRMRDRLVDAELRAKREGERARWLAEQEAWAERLRARDERTA